MNTKKIQKEAADLYDLVVGSNERYFFLVRDIGFLKKSEISLNNLLQDILRYKKKLISMGDNEGSNFLLSIESAVKMHLNEVNMLISLKEDDPDLAWDYFVKMESFYRRSLKAYPRATFL